MAGRIGVYFVVGGRFHDFDFARLEILKLLHVHERIRVRVAEDYSNTTAIAAADALVSFTCDVRPDESQQDALTAYLDSGKRWFALHGTNSIIEWQPDGRVATPRSVPRFVRLLGSQFMAHPPLGDFLVQVTDPSHPLVRGIEPFTVNDHILHIGGSCGVAIARAFGVQADPGLERQLLGRLPARRQARTQRPARMWLRRPVPVQIEPHARGERQIRQHVDAALDPGARREARIERRG